LVGKGLANRVVSVYIDCVPVHEEESAIGCNLGLMAR
jgi:hypothetical protein